MIPLGHALNFYLRYPDEMDYFGYEDNECDVSWLNEKDQEIFIAECGKVCDQAWKDFRRLAAVMWTQMQGKFQKANINTAPRILKNEWEWSLDFWFSKKRPAKVMSQVGVHVGTNAKGQMVATPWVWARGGRRREDSLRKILNLGTVNDGHEFFSGTVPIAHIILQPLESDLDASLLLKAIMVPLLAFKKQHWKKVWDLAQSED